MSEQDTTPTSSADSSEAPDGSTDTDAQAEPARPDAGTASGARADDRNEEIEESPVPDPTRKDTDAGDDPEAD